MRYKKFLALILFLTSLVILGEISLVFLQGRGKVREERRPQTQLSVRRIATSVLSFSPQIATFKTGEEFKVKVIVDSQENTLSGAELYILYDPVALEAEAVVPGDFFEKPNILLKEINSKKGEISFALGTFFPKKGSKDVLAEIIFETKPILEEKLTVLSFSPKTKLADINQEESVIKLMNSVSYTILP